MLLIYSSRASPRCQYIFDLIFKEEFRIDFRITSDIHEFETSQFEKLNYSEKKKFE
jgi:hypothetical protein